MNREARTVALRFLMMFCWSLLAGNVHAANIADIIIDFKQVRVGASRTKVICPVSAIPRKSGSSSNSYCKRTKVGQSGYDYYQYDLTCADASGASANPSITFKATGTPVDFEILDKNLDLPSFMTCRGSTREYVCEFHAPGTFQYSIKTKNETELCVLDPRIIITDESKDRESVP